MLATFTRRPDAATAASRAAGAFPRAHVELGSVDDELDALALGQEAEMDESIPVVSTGLFSGPWARGALFWGAIGFVVGALLAVPVTFVVDAEAPWWGLALAFAAAGGLALSSATFILGAGARSIKEGETTPEDPTAVVRADIGSHDADAVVDWFVEVGARHAWVVTRPVDRWPTEDVEAPRSPYSDPAATAGAQSDHDAGFPSDELDRRPDRIDTERP